MNIFLTTLIVVAAVGSGLIAGLFFTFSTFVMKALGQVAPSHGIEAMQAINLTVMNSVTMGVFMGTAVLSLASVGYAAFNWQMPGSAWLLAGGLLYLASFVITAAGNVPMNDALALMDASTRTAAEYWEQYLTNWTYLNHMRTVAAALAVAAYALAVPSMSA
ncbi:MAG: anthrone oxygenase family protein [Planctomycetota bacterium]